MDKINFRELMANQVEGNSADVEFCLKFAEEHQAKGDMTDADIMHGIIDILAMRSNHARVREIMDLNAKISEGIHGLQDMACWPNLSKVAEHALDACIKTVEAEKGKPFADYAESQKVRLAALQTSSDEFKSVFTKEFLDKMGWVGKDFVYQPKRSLADGSKA